MDKENGDHQDRGGKKAKVMAWIDTLDTIPQDWRLFLKAELESEYFAKIIAFLDSQKCVMYPPRELVFNALIHCPMDRIKVVIIGQDPYHGEDQAHGLSFSVLEPTKPPPSLKNIYKELSTDIEGFNIPKSGDLTKWATQGVLLLNASLTVEKGKANSHSKIGWFKFTDAIIKSVNVHCSNVVFLLVLKLSN